jgi:hypothetical protein
MYRRVIPICLGRSIDRQDGEDFKICVSGHFQIWAAVVKCIEARAPVYLVKDDHGEILEGTFYVEELQKVIKTDDVYKIEPTAQQGRPQGTVLRFDRQVVNVDYDNRVQNEYLTQTYDLRTSFHKSHKTIHCPCHSVPFARLTLQVGVVCFCRSCLRIQLLKDNGYPSHLTNRTVSTFKTEVETTKGQL